MRKAIWISAFLLLAVGCDGGESEDTDSGMEPEVDAGPAPRDAGRDAGMRTDAGETGDGNDDFASADTITIDPTEGTLGAIAEPGDLDYYTFTGTEGQWVQILTEANPDDNPEMIDTVITLYDAEMNQIAENDDSVPRVNTDSELIVRLPATGTYYVLVQEFSTWAGETPEGDETFEYALGVFTIDLEAAETNVDAEGGDDAASAQVLTTATTGGGTFSLVLGDFNDGTDVDVYSVTVPEGEPRNLSVNVMPSGSEGYGSTATISRIWVTNADGTTIIARIDPSDLQAVEPSLTGGTYLVFVETMTAPGDNGFYVLKAFTIGDNPPEANDVANNLTATADPLTFENVATGGRSAFVLAQLGDADTDTFSITSLEGEELTVVCGSFSLGSGVQGLRAEVFSSDGLTETAVASDNEDPVEGVQIADEPLAPAGTYYLRLTKTGQDVEVTGTWVRCGIHLQVPAP